MTEQIIRFLKETRTGKKSDKAVLEMIAGRFGGTVNGRYVKIDGVEYLVRRDPDRVDCGFEVRRMDWTHGNDWKFYSPY